LQWWYYAAGAAIVLIAALVGWKLYSTHPAASIQFHQLTYRRGNLTDARFTSDGQNVIYTAEWERAKPEVYTAPANGVGGHALGIANARLLAVSKQGEEAVALDPRRLASFVIAGTLARSSGSSAPKPEIENVVGADYTPDGAALAIVRYLPDKAICQLEYPIGKVLYTANAIDDLRFSPDGRYLAFIPHDNPYDDRGTTVILRANGEKVATSMLYESTEGLAWTPSGDEVWFTSPLENGQIHALSLSGKNREVLSVPGRLFLRDIASNGQLLAEQGIAHLGSMVLTAGQNAPRDLSWLDYGFFRALSDDGQMILFDEEGQASAAYTIYVRATDGSPAISIGEGYGAALSRDKKWVLDEKLNQEIWLMPVGAGEPRRISPPGFLCRWAGFLPDGNHVVYIAQKNGGPFRTWLQDLDGGDPRPISPPNIVGVLSSPEGKWLLAGRDSDLTERRTLIVPVDGGAPVTIAGLKPEDYPIGWTSDDHLFVAPRIESDDSIVHVQKLDPRNGARTAWQDIPLLPLGGVRSANLVIASDGRSYGYLYNLELFDLYTISGVR
jgi:dipeptidyl aminopeptidase/acylaminoacyl peptidase